jgi:hypothetical protein
MKDEYILGGILLVAIGCFYYFAVKKPSLSVQLMDSSGNLYAKGSKDNPITTEDIQAVTDLLTNLLTLKAQQPTS